MLEAWAKLVATGKDSEPTGAKIAPLALSDKNFSLKN